MPDFLINGYYPQVYWNLPNVDETIDSYQLWWSSDERPVLDSVTGSTAEILEVDFGRKRSVNYISFDITYKPVDITIEYDEWSFSDSALERRWKAVSPIRNNRGTQAASFDNAIFYVDGASTNPWFHAQFFFQGVDGLPITTQRLRLTFNRRIETPVFDAGTNFPWAVDVQNLRTARYVTNLTTARGILIESGNWDGFVDLTEPGIQEVWQNFVMPGDYIRAENGGLIQPRDPVITEMVPSMLGVGIFVGGPNTEGLQAQLTGVVDADGNVIPTVYNYSLRDVTSGRDKVLVYGQASGAITNGAGWIDVMFDTPVPTSTNAVYQLRISSEDVSVSSAIYSKGLANSSLSSNPLRESNDEDTANIDAYLSIQGSDPVALTDTAILFRVWADIGEAGKDIFGNEYREGVRRDAAENVVDSAIQTNWISGPNPDPSAVESLYFDVRNIDEITGQKSAAIIDTIKVNPLTPGIFMNVYYSNDSPVGDPPTTVDWPDGWEGMRWTPIVGASPYILSRQQTIELPQPVRASWVCLEFSSLQPLPFKLPELTNLPPVKYRRFPNYLYTRLNQIKPTQDDINVTGSTPVALDIFSLYTTISEFDNVLGVNPNLSVNFIRAMALRTASTRALGSISATAPIDPRTLAQIFYSGTQMYYSTIPTQTNTTNSVLGSYVAAAYSQANKSYSPTELPAGSFAGTDFVSNVNERSDQAGSMSPETLTPIWFSNIERHHYDVTYGGFRTGKAYFAGISDISFLRKNFAQRRDDPVIHDILGESSLISSPLIAFNTWKADLTSRIALSQSIWVTYSINDVPYTDMITFEDDTASDFNFTPIALSVGGGRANNIVAYGGEDKTGDLFVLDDDYTVIYDSTLKINYIQRSTLHQRFVSISAHKTIDAQTVAGKAVISDVEHFAGIDAGTVISTINLVTTEAFQHAGITTKVKIDSAGGKGVAVLTATGSKVVL